MLYSDINDICIYVYNMAYSMAYSICLIIYAICHTCFAYIAYPEWYITFQSVI